MNNKKIELINSSKKYDRESCIRPRATVFKDKSKYSRKSAKEMLRRDIANESH